MRTFSEQFGFNPLSFVVTTLVSIPASVMTWMAGLASTDGSEIVAAWAAVALLATTFALWATSALKGERIPARRLFWASFGGLVFGSASSETAILVDESAFIAEASRAPMVASSRARAWPYVNCSLVYNPGRGFHATD